MAPSQQNPRPSTQPKAPQSCWKLSIICKLELCIVLVLCICKLKLIVNWNFIGFSTGGNKVVNFIKLPEAC